MSDLHFVFLQGMPSPFFKQIGAELLGMGCRVTRINLCIGDWIFWRGPNAISFRGRYGDWRRFISDLFDQNKVTDLVLLGEQRWYHKEAVAIAQARGIRVTVTDFGYLRPDWITLERDGMGGNSRFPRIPEELVRLATLVPKADLEQRYTDSVLRMMAADLLYNFSNLFFWWLYPHYRRSDRRPHPLIYTPASGKHLLLTHLGKRHNNQKVQRLVDSKSPYFVFPLQLDHDFQIVAYSPFDGMRDAIEMVIESFSGHADSNMRLVVKVHPWDTGLQNWEKLIRQFASGYGISDRIDYLCGGNLDELIRGSCGMVTVNSTSGIRALQLGSPVKILGQAVYDVPGLTYQGELDDFWGDADQPDPILLQAFINVMAATIQIRGVFFSESGRSAAVTAVVQRLYDKAVSVPTSPADR